MDTPIIVDEGSHEKDKAHIQKDKEHVQEDRDGESCNSFVFVSWAYMS